MRDQLPEAAICFRGRSIFSLLKVDVTRWLSETLARDIESRFGSETSRVDLGGGGRWGLGLLMPKHVDLMADRYEDKQIVSKPARDPDIC